MTINAGVWIDHHKAVVVLLSEGGQSVRQFHSEKDAAARPSRDRPMAEDKCERKAMIQLEKYYDEVIACLHDAEEILVVGPGEAKGEFTKRIEGKRLKGRIAPAETVDKMTDGQIAAYVRERFQ